MTPSRYVLNKLFVAVHVRASRADCIYVGLSKGWTGASEEYISIHS